MDYTKFFSKITSRRKTNLIRDLTHLYMIRQNGVNLAGGMPNTSTYPINNISMTYKYDVPVELNKQETSAVLQYGSSQGYAPLLEKWKEFQKTWHSPKRNDWDVAFTCGTMDGCEKIFQMLINENDPVMLQVPTYTGIIGALAPLSPDVIEINQDADGIIPEEISKKCEERLKDGRPMPKLLYINPTGTNPTGAVISEIRRRKVYELAQKYNFLIIEDDPYCFIHFLNKQPMSFFSLDTDGRVIRMDSFSKIISAGFRVGAITAHKDIINRLVIHIASSILHASCLSQMFLYKLFENWRQQEFEQHFKEIQKFYRERRDMMLTIIEKHLTGLAEWYIPQGGMFFWIKVTVVNDTKDLVMNKCVPQGVFVLPGNAFNYDSSKHDCHLRLSYSYASLEEMDKGISIIAKILREEAAKKK
ncbi:PREDICTED: kynurenine/alpha-aminoadipate aminotransferase, mitochondrial-like isoform X1 [Atta colombica]|nr:PREDICTED: kynurenine/alpha-aminoadipate aminotransferase, mitochondrial-like isoform X1 [Atta colombica]XP_018053460.1 PREDICTED: kynurenine/alpha-aminoadipate aminotransferase, mitochondrial-like isoform X1 [Atta colombica]